MIISDEACIVSIKRNDFIRYAQIVPRGQAINSDYHESTVLLINRYTSIAIFSSMYLGINLLIFLIPLDREEDASKTLESRQDQITFVHA